MALGGDELNIWINFAHWYSSYSLRKISLKRSRHHLALLHPPLMVSHGIINSRWRLSFRHHWWSRLVAWSFKTSGLASLPIDLLQHMFLKVTSTRVPSSCHANCISPYFYNTEYHGMTTFSGYDNRVTLRKPNWNIVLHCNESDESTIPYNWCAI